MPLTAVMFVAETTDRPSFVVPGPIATVAAELLMGTASVTDHQVDHTAPAGERPSPPGAIRRRRSWREAAR